MRLVLLLILCLSSLALADKDTHIGFLSKVKGKVLLIDNSNKKEKKAKRGTKIYQYHSIQTAKGGRAKLILKNGTLINIAENTLFEVKSIAEKNSKETSSFKLLYGKVRSIVNPKESKKVKIESPSAVMGVRGTDFFASFKRNFKKRSSITQVHTLSGDVALWRKTDNQSNAISIKAGFKSQIEVLPSGEVLKPNKVKKFDKHEIKVLNHDMLQFTSKELNLASPRSDYLKLIDEMMKEDFSTTAATTDELPSNKITFTDNTEVPEGTTKQSINTTQKESELKQKAQQEQKDQTQNIQKQQKVETKPAKELKSNIAKTNKKETTVAMAAPDTKAKPKKAVQKSRKELYKARFDIDTWKTDPRWKIIQELIEKNGKKSLIRFIRHASVSQKQKKKTKLSTLDATFYDKTANIKMLVPSKKVKKLATRAFDKNNRYRGVETEFWVDPGNYYVTIDNGPVKEIVIPEARDITFKTSVFISPNSNYSVFNPLLQSFIPLRDEGNPIFVLPGAYIITKTLVNRKGISTGQKQKKKFKIDANTVLTPTF